MRDDEDMPETQLDASATPPPLQNSAPPEAAPERKPWARLVGIGPTADFGVFDLFERQVVVGATKNAQAVVKIDDPRISRTHCKLFLDGNDYVQLLDDSSNGTWWNNVKMGRGVLRMLSSMDSIVLLQPNPQHQTEQADETAGAPGVVRRAANYQFMFIDLRPARAMPPPAAPPGLPRLLRGTSLSAEGRPEDYETICELGRGSFAVVRKVRHKASGVEYAMKVMEKKKLLRGVGGSAAATGRATSEVRDKVLSEARILRTVDHPNVIRFVDIFETELHLHLVMELVEGGELFDHLVERGAFAEPDARAIMHQLLSALQHLHARHIVHRDLKPENILLQTQPAGAPSTLPVIKIADFGLAKLVGAESKAATFCGTPQYFAPEVLDSRNSRRGYDTACDLWSVGVLMYILLSRSQPFADEDDAYAVGPDGLPPPHALSIFDKIREGVSAAHFSEPVWAGISPAAIDLISQLLVVDPRKRLGVNGALNHPWMRGEVGVAADVARLMAARRERNCDEIEDSDEDDDGNFRPPPPRLPPPASKRQKSTVPHRAYAPAHLAIAPQPGPGNLGFAPQPGPSQHLAFAPQPGPSQHLAMVPQPQPATAPQPLAGGPSTSGGFGGPGLLMAPPPACGGGGGGGGLRSQPAGARHVASLAIMHGPGK